MDKHDDLDNDSTHELQKLQQDMVDVPVVKFSDESADADLNDSDPVISGELFSKYKAWSKLNQVTFQSLVAIGQFGWFQLRSFLLLSFVYLNISWAVISIAYLNADTDYWCSMPQHLKDANISVQEWKSMSGQTEDDKCHIYNKTYEVEELSNPQSLNDPVWTKVPCTDYEFDTSLFTSTITSEWSLVCQSKYGISLAQSVYFFGQLCGITTFGILADKIGRKKTFIPLTFLAALFGCASAMFPQFEVFLVFRFLTAFVSIGAYECMFSWLLEICAGKWPAVVSQGFFLFWVGSWLTITPIAYHFRAWRDLLMAVSIPKFFLFFIVVFIPESPKWLLAVGRVDEAEKVVRKIAKINKREDRLGPGWTLEGRQAMRAEDKKANVWDLFRHKQLRTKTLILLFIWFSISATYFGLSMNAGDLGVSIFVKNFISGLVELPGYSGAMMAMNLCGRKNPFGISMILTGFFLIIINSVPPKPWLITTLAFIGKALITAAFGTVYVVSGELFPTIMRTTGVGIACCVARVGGILAPWIALLGAYHKFLPVMVYGSLAFVSGCLALILPETKGRKMPDSIQESEELSVKMSNVTMCACGNDL